MSSKSVDFSTVQKVAEKGISEYCIVDVRRGDEVKTTGLIPSSHHIPLAELGEALKLEEDEFQTKYGFKKPSKDQKVIFTCHAGVRAKSATEVACSLGYSDALCYDGSWAEWSSKHKK